MGNPCVSFGNLGQQLALACSRYVPQTFNPAVQLNQEIKINYLIQEILTDNPSFSLNSPDVKEDFIEFAKKSPKLALVLVKRFKTDPGKDRILKVIIKTLIMKSVPITFPLSSVIEQIENPQIQQKLTEFAARATEKNKGGSSEGEDRLISKKVKPDKKLVKHIFYLMCDQKIDLIENEKQQSARLHEACDHLPEDQKDNILWKVAQKIHWYDNDDTFFDILSFHAKTIKARIAALVHLRNYFLELHSPANKDGPIDLRKHEENLKNKEMRLISGAKECMLSKKTFFINVNLMFLSFQDKFMQKADFLHEIKDWDSSQKLTGLILASNITSSDELALLRVKIIIKGVLKRLKNDLSKGLAKFQKIFNALRGVDCISTIKQKENLVWHLLYALPWHYNASAFLLMLFEGIQSHTIIHIEIQIMVILQELFIEYQTSQGHSCQEAEANIVAAAAEQGKSKYEYFCDFMLKHASIETKKQFLNLTAMEKLRKIIINNIDYFIPEWQELVFFIYSQPSDLLQNGCQDLHSEQKDPILLKVAQEIRWYGTSNTVFDFLVKEAARAKKEIIDIVYLRRLFLEEFGEEQNIKKTEDIMINEAKSHKLSKRDYFIKEHLRVLSIPDNLMEEKEFLIAIRSAKGRKEIIDLLVSQPMPEVSPKTPSHRIPANVPLQNGNNLEAILSNFTKEFESCKLVEDKAALLFGFTERIPWHHQQTDFLFSFLAKVEGSNEYQDIYDMLNIQRLFIECFADAEMPIHEIEDIMSAEARIKDVDNYTLFFDRICSQCNIKTEDRKSFGHSLKDKEARDKIISTLTSQLGL